MNTASESFHKSSLLLKKKEEEADPVLAYLSHFTGVSRTEWCMCVLSIMGLLSLCKHHQYDKMRRKCQQTADTIFKQLTKEHLIYWCGLTWGVALKSADEQKKPRTRIHGADLTLKSSTKEARSCSPLHPRRALSRSPSFPPSLRSTTAGAPTCWFGTPLLTATALKPSSVCPLTHLHL